MALKLSTGLRNNLMGTSGFGTLFANGVVRIYDGAPPDSPDDVATGNLLCTFSAINFGTTGTSGTIGKTVTTVSGTAGLAGVAGYFRLSDSSDTPGSASTTAKRIDGLMGLASQEDADYILPVLTLTLGQSLTIPQATFGLPETP